MSTILMVIGWFLLASTTFVWGGHGIWELLKTDQGFFTVLMWNGLWWCLQGVIGVLSIGVGFALSGRHFK